MALTLPVMVPPSLQMVRMRSQFCLELGLFLGEDDHAFLVFELFDQDVNLVADLDGLDVVKFVGGDDAFAFVADVHQDFLGADFDDGSFDDFASGKACISLCFRASSMVSIIILCVSGRTCGRLGRREAPLRRLHCLTDQTLQWQRRLKVRLFVNFSFSASMNHCHNRAQATET